MIICSVDMNVVYKAMKKFKLVARRQVPTFLKALFPPLDAEQVKVIVPVDIKASQLNWLLEQQSCKLTFKFMLPIEEYDY
jgi:hypothetical protein